jgi:hypothetical protein
MQDLVYFIVDLRKLLIVPLNARKRRMHVVHDYCFLQKNTFSH